MKSKGSDAYGMLSSLGNKLKKVALNMSDIEIKVEEATSNEPWGPHGTLMGEISKAAYDWEQYRQVMGVIGRRLQSTGEDWRHVYKSLILLEYLLKHGPTRIIQELESSMSVLQKFHNFKYVDENGKDWGLNVRHRAKELTELVNNRERVEQERNKARALKSKYGGLSSQEARMGASSFRSRAYDDFDSNIEKAAEKFGEYGTSGGDKFGSSTTTKKKTSTYDTYDEYDPWPAKKERSSSSRDKGDCEGDRDPVEATKEHGCSAATCAPRGKRGSRRVRTSTLRAGSPHHPACAVSRGRRAAWAAMALETLSALAPPQQALELDQGKLLDYLRGQLPGLDSSSGAQVRQFTHGQSNPTYLIEVGGRRFVLRKKPPGRVLASAHAVDREFAVLQALAGTPVPVPRPRALCTDASVLGTPFYVMDHVQGVVFTDPAMPGAAPGERRAAYLAMARTLAALHSADFRALGLAGFGRHSGYCSRQVWRWGRQYAAQLRGPPLPEMQRLTAWLESHVPACDSLAGTTTIVHGDYRLDNLVLDSGNRGSVKAVLDWELSTLGHPLADLAYSALPWHLPRDFLAVQALPQPPPEGVPSEREYVAAYCAARGIPPPDPAVYSFCLALSIFRMAAISAGIGARAAAGNAASQKAAQFGSPEVVRALAQRALQIIAASPAPPAAPPCQTQSLVARMAASGGGGGAGGEVAGRRAAALPPGLEPPPHVARLARQLQRFMEQRVLPAEPEIEALASSDRRWTVHPKLEALKTAAKAEGLWNLWLPPELAERLRPLAGGGAEGGLLGAGLSTFEYSHLSEVMGRVVWASEVFNCSAPDTGNMEVLARYGTLQQQRRWLLPLLRGDIRSCFAMTEPAVASSDATNIRSSIAREGDSYVLNGRKWWASGAPDPRCKLAIFMGKSDTSAPPHRQQSMVLVPMDAAGVTVVRPLPVFGYDDAPHGHAEVLFKDVRVPADSMLLGEGRGFEIAQGRLGPGRLHHCMRLIGMGERAMELMGRRALSREAFGRPLARHGAFAADFARCRVQLNAARLAVLDAAAAVDRHGAKQARDRIAVAKVLAPQAALQVLDRAIQTHGGAGVSDDTPLARLWAGARTLRLADGPDEVHLAALAKAELARLAPPAAKL